MNLNKSLEFFNPTLVTAPVHVIGLGAIGSNLIDTLARLGIANFVLYDFDIVSTHNVANQRFDTTHFNKEKTQACLDIILNINPAAKVVLHTDGYVDQRLSGHVFLCVDSIELRKKIVGANLYNPNILSMYDFRLRLSDAQHYAAVWHDQKSKDKFYGSMQFTSEEAKASTPVSACGTTLSVMPTVLIIVSMGVANFLNLIKSNTYKNMILIDAFHHDVLAVPED